MVPEGLKYSREHEWIKVEGDLALAGITYHAQEQLGDIVYVELPTVGQTFAAMDKIGSIESVKTVSDLFTPVGGEILELNPFLLDRIGGAENPDFHPEYVNQDPYGKGWMVKIRMKDCSDLDALMGPEEYERFLEEASS